MDRRQLLAAGLGLALPRQEEEERRDGLPSDRILRRYYRRQKKAQRRDLVEWLRLELRSSGSFQNRVLATLLKREPGSPDMWPALDGLRHYDPEIHTPNLKKKVRRRRLSAKSSKGKKATKAFLPEPAEGDFDSIWTYHWGDRVVYRNGERVEPDRIFENALKGHPPDVDLLHALALKNLDDGREEKILAAFSHAYADRDGNVFPHVSIYDAWSSGKTLEMPDIDVLGIVHDVLNDWKTWTAPIAPRDHGEVYGKIGELFKRARRYRALREVLAKCLVTGKPVLGGGYDSSLEVLHVFWDEHGSDPYRLAESLPDGTTWREFLVAWQGRFGREPELQARGRKRRQVLEADARRVRSTLVWVMREYGALPKDE